MNNIIELNNIYKIYKNGTNGTFALNDVSLTIKENDFISIVGSSGSGKSTIMNIIGCLDFPTSGSYKLYGDEIVGKNMASLAKIRNSMIGFIFQQYFLLPKLNVLENVELPLLYKGIEVTRRKSEALYALDVLGIADKAMQYPNQLSGGQQQRVAIARAIAVNPPLILADEPTGALDSKNGQDVIEIIKNLHRGGKTVIMITHDSTIAKETQTIIKISDGKICAINNLENNNGI